MSESRRRAMQQMQVTVPAGVGPGMAFQVNTPAGPMQVTCPPGATAGGQMLVNVPAAPQPVVMEEHGEIWIYYSGVNRDHAGILDPKAPTPPADGCIPEKSGGSNDVITHL